MHKKLYVLLLISLFSSKGISQDDSLEKVYLKDCAGQSLVIFLPDFFCTVETTKTENGFIKSYVFSNDGTISVHCRRQPSSAEKKSVIYVPNSTNRFSRIEKLKGISLSYHGVSKARKEAFEKAFNRTLAYSK